MNDLNASNQPRFAVVEIRTGRIRSRHSTERLAFDSIDRYERSVARMWNRPGLMGGGYGQPVELAVQPLP